MKELLLKLVASDRKHLDGFYLQRWDVRVC